MNEKKRILDLVAAGVISTDEAVVLLENLAKTTQETSDFDDVVLDDITIEEHVEDVVEDIKGAFEDIEDALEDVEDAIDELEDSIDELEDRIEEQEELYDEMEATLDTENKKTTLAEVALTIAQLRKQRQALIQQQKALEEQREQLQKYATVDYAKEFTQGARQVGNAAKSLFESGFFGDMLKKVTNMFSENVLAGFSEEPTIVKNYTFSENLPSIIDVRVANGKVQFKPSEDDYLNVTVSAFFHKSLQNEDIEAAYAERVTVQQVEDKLVVQVPNQRIRAHLIVGLPKQEYDYLSAAVQNGKIDLQAFSGKDIYLSVDNGNVSLTDVAAVVSEVSVDNGSCHVVDGDIRDLLVNVTNGSVQTNSRFYAAKCRVSNGKLAIVVHDNAQKLIGEVSNGKVVVQVPENKALQGTLRGDSYLDVSDVTYTKNGKVTSLHKAVADQQPLDMDLSVYLGRIDIKQK